MHQGHIFYVHDGNKEVDQALCDQWVVYVMKKGEGSNEVVGI